MHDYEDSPFLIEPFRLADNCLVNDGGRACILTSLERACDLRHPPVTLMGRCGVRQLGLETGTKKPEIILCSDNGGVGVANPHLLSFEEVDAMTPPAKPSSRINADTAPFWEACRNHRLQVQQCTTCGWMRWPPAFLCPRCHGKYCRWQVCSGKGRIYSYVVYHKAFHPAFKNVVPYVVAIVALAEGPSMVSNIVGCDPSEVCCEMPVEVTWEDWSEEFSLPLFNPSNR